MITAFLAAAIFTVLFVAIQLLSSRQRDERVKRLIRPQGSPLRHDAYTGPRYSTNGREIEPTGRSTL